MEQTSLGSNGLSTAAFKDNGHIYVNQWLVYIFDA